MRRSTWTLVGLGAVMTAGVLAPVVYIESGELVPIDSAYVRMMIVPALAASAAVLYQARRGIDRPSAIAIVLIGIVIATFPFWGPSLDEGMRMPLEWIGTILGHYVPGALVVVAGVLQLTRARAIAAPAHGGTS